MLIHKAPLRIVFFATFLPLIFACSCYRPLTVSQIAGDYVSEYSYGREELTLRNDGSFAQQIHLNSPPKDLESAGTWEYDRETRRVELENMRIVDDGFGRLLPDYDKPKLGLASFPVERNPLTGNLRLSQGDLNPFTKR